MEFQAVVMAAGRGSRMTEITSGCPKYLLPIGNLPLVFYPLYTLKQAGFQEAIVIVPEMAKTKSVVDSLSGRLDMKLDIVPIPSQEEWGTADSLRFIRSKITTDILVISCDLVTDFPLCELADVFRASDATLTILLSNVPSSLKEASVPGYKGKHREEKDIIGINNLTGKLLLLNSEADFEEEVSMKVSLLKRNPVMHMYSNLMDGHVYIMKKWIVDYLGNNESISTLKGELLPLLVRKQKNVKPNIRHSQNTTSSITSFNIEKDIYSYIKEDKTTDLIYKLSDKSGNEDKTQISCYAHIAKNNLFMRVNTLAAYAEINRQISKHLSAMSSKLTNISKPLTPTNIHHHKSNNSNDCIIGEHTTIADKASVKKSVIGQNCQVKEKVKIINSVIMDHVVIEEGSCIQGSIICSQTCLGKQCEIKDSVIGRGQQVADLCKLTHQVLQDVDRLLEI